MKKINEKGFVLLETVIVAVFIISIFTFVYMSVVPLIGRYDELYNNYELEKTYKLYHIRDAIYKDEKFSTIVEKKYNFIKANDFSNQSYYNSLANTLFDDDYQIVYIRGISTNLNNALTDLGITGSFKEYIESTKKNKASDDFQNFLFLKDGKRFAHLGLATDLNDLTKYVDNN